MNHFPLISVIVPTKNEEKNIIRCLQSINNQKYNGKIELIVVDNHSQDTTVHLAKQFTSLVFIAGNERSQQRNIGAKKAKGQWILFIDADMELSKNVVAEAVMLTQKKAKPPILAIKEKAIGYTFITRALALEKNCYINAKWLIAARFFPRREFLRLGGYDETLISGEDWAITQMFLAKNFSLNMSTSSYIIHHEAKAGLQELLQKELYYIKYINRYAEKYPLAFSYQRSLLYRTSIWLHSWKNLTKHPILTLTFLSYKLIVWVLWIMRKFRFISYNYE